MSRGDGSSSPELDQLTLLKKTMVWGIEVMIANAPSETILTTSSLLTAFNMNKALNRSCKGVAPDVLSRVALSEFICAGVTCTDIVLEVDTEEV